MGLTVQLTPRGRSCVLHATSVGTEVLEVGSDDPSCTEIAFDYIVHGLRIGFEEIPVVQPKGDGEEAPIPSMAGYRALVAQQPELASYTPLERFRSMPAAAFPDRAGALDLSRAQALVAAIHEFDPATDGISAPEPLAAPAEGAEPAAAEAAAAENPPAPGFAAPVRRTSVGLVVAEVAREPAAAASAVPPGAVPMPVSGAVEAGMLLALDPRRAGGLRVAASMGDPGIVGIAAAGADGAGEVLVLGTGFASVRVDAGYGAIVPGDLLVSSPTAGHAMRALEVVPGTIVGKALEPLETGKGTIRVLLMAR
ncbi:MAG: hypothetical protein Q9Q13_04095 [Acidobacteriota bacterium]|nr:hypothetical protein [Acidobacteriota bacterium]